MQDQKKWSSRPITYERKQRAGDKIQFPKFDVIDCNKVFFSDRFLTNVTSFSVV